MRHLMRMGGGVGGLFLLMAWLAPAAPEDAIQRAVNQGVRYLRDIQNQDGTWPYQQGGQNQIGATALAGLTLLECGAPALDPAVQNASRAVRQQCTDLNTTYALALAIMFFDRLADPGDVPLIHALAVRLMGGQHLSSGGWTYTCPVVGGDAEMRRLGEIIRQQNELAARRVPFMPAPPGKRERPPLPRELQDQLTLLNRQQAVPLGRGDHGVGGDNSNTQFAILGLWVARRHGIPCELALDRVAGRFRNSQQADGGWGYTPGMPSSPAMTCAGLLGLGVAHGAANEAAARATAKDAKGTKPAKDKGARDPARDPAVKAGLLALGTTIGAPGDWRAVAPRLAGRMGRGHYFLWSMERVAVAFGLPTIGKKDWYAWGAQILVATQDADGAWRGEYAEGGVDTCFALLFLRRSNLAQDLTASLKGKIQDPGEVVLRSGGVGGESLKSQTLKSGVELVDKTAPSPGPAKDAGVAPASFPPPASERTEGDAAKLGSQLVKAPADQQEALLNQMREGKGTAFTQTLAAAIPQLSGPTKAKARDALAERLARMSADTLREKFRDANVEVRRAAALACVIREEKSCIPDLVTLLQDAEALVSRAALVALKDLTGQDFGPAPTATRAEREQALAKWKGWWAKQGGK